MQLQMIPFRLKAFFVGGTVLIVAAVLAMALLKMQHGQDVVVPDEAAQINPVEPQAQPKEVNGASQVLQVALDGTVIVPERYRFADIAKVQTGFDFENWMGRFSDQEQAVLRAFDATHFGVYQKTNPEIIAWMAATGYPMPEDVLAAQGWSDDALEALAHAGNIKAGFLWNDRLLDQLAREVGAATDEAKTDRIHALALSMERANATAASPYKAYLIARRNWTLMPGLKKNPSRPYVYEEAIDILEGGALSALMWASCMGDLRAIGAMSAYSQRDFVTGKGSRASVTAGVYATWDLTQNMDRGSLSRNPVFSNCRMPGLPAYPMPEYPMPK